MDRGKGQCRTVHNIAKRGQLLMKVYNFGIKNKFRNFLWRLEECVCVARVSGGFNNVM